METKHIRANVVNPETGEIVWWNVKIIDQASDTEPETLIETDQNGPLTYTYPPEWVVPLGHPTDHRPEWEGDEATGDTVCTVCGAVPQPMRCVNCGRLVDETVWAHGSMRRGTHSTRKHGPARLT